MTEKQNSSNKIFLFFSDTFHTFNKLTGVFAIAIDSYFESKSLNINREENEFEKA